MINKKTVIFDMHGVIFCHSPDYNLETSSAMFKTIVKLYSQKYEKYKQAWDDYQKGNKKQALEIEKISILKGIEGEKEELQIYEMPGAISCLMGYEKMGFKISIVSTSEEETSRAILEKFMQNHRIKDYVNILDSFDIITTSTIGSKDELKTWKEIFSGYTNITDIYEDNQKYLFAAGKAAESLGHRPKLHSVTDVL